MPKASTSMSCIAIILSFGGSDQSRRRRVCPLSSPFSLLHSLSLLLLLLTYLFISGKTAVEMGLLRMSAKGVGTSKVTVKLVCDTPITCLYVEPKIPCLQPCIICCGSSSVFMLLTWRFGSSGLGCVSSSPNTSADDAARGM